MEKDISPILFASQGRASGTTTLLDRRLDATRMAPNWSRSGTMPVNLSIKNAPDDIVDELRRRAERHHRSLQGELMAILEAAVRPRPALSPDEVLAEIRRMGLSSPAEAAEIVRADRDRR